jgi:hypothetical protein
MLPGLFTLWVRTVFTKTHYRKVEEISTGRQERRRKQLFDDLKEMRRYRKYKGGKLDRSLWRLTLEEAMDLS